MIEDGDEEENDDDNYRSMFPEYADTTMEDNEEEGQGEEWAPDEPADDLGWVIFVHSEAATPKRRGCSLSRCYRTTTNYYTQLVKMARRS
jgi:hypothetical protein